MLDLPQRTRDWVPRLPTRITDPIATRLLDFLTHIEEAEPDEILDYEDKTKLIDQEFLELFHYHSKWPFWSICMLLVGLVYDISQGPINPQIYGLALDGMGAVFLALGIVRGRSGLARDTRETAGRFGGGGFGGMHQASLKAQIADTIDGIFGGTLLITGFVIQTAALWGTY